LDLKRIVAELKSEQDRIRKAINALLEGTRLNGPTKDAARKAVAPKRGGGMTPAGRRRQAAAMRLYWAARRAKSGPISAKTTTVAKKAALKRGGLTTAGRNRLSEMMKKRWAEKKKKAS
jgi:hypothetical protein